MDLSDRELHDSGACGGVGDLCTFCDEAMAARIKTAARKPDYSSVATESAE